MSRKAFLVQVELDVQAVTCPGVWLCCNGRVSLQIYMLDSCVQTASYKPYFPVKLNETFTFYKSFYSTHRLNELQKELQEQWLYMELVQWESCEIGNVLATFQTTLDELLYPSTSGGSIAGVDMDLLMEPSKVFPGTIAPKIEVSTKTTIEETLCSSNKPESSTVVVNPKILTSSCHKPRRNAGRKVCHSVMYSKNRPQFKPPKTRPPFCYRKAEDDLILRKPQYDLNANYCRCTRRARSLERQKSPTNPRRPELSVARSSPCKSLETCICGNVCPVCSKYSGYFNLASLKFASQMEQNKGSKTTQPRTTLFSPNKRCHKHAKNGHCQFCRPASENKSQSDESNTSDEDKKLCLWPRDKPSLAEKLHARLTKTLCSIPKSIEWSCYDYDYDLRCDCCECPSKGELYRSLQKFYGDLYEKTRSNVNTVCVPDCQGLNK